MGAGVLPIARYNNEIYYLFSRERLDFSNDKDKGKWSDFGGSREKNESQYTTAVREAFEESAGLLGSQNDIKMAIKNNLVSKIYDKKYSIWIIEVKYDKIIEKKFNQHYKNALINKPSIVKEKNGLFEKDRVKCVNSRNLHTFKHKCRRFYKSYIPRLINVAKKFKHQK